MTEYIAALT